MIEALVAIVISAILLLVMYLTSAGALQLSALVDLATDVDDEEERQGGRWALLARSSRDVLLAADLFKSLAFGIMLALAMWAVPNWCASIGWPQVPCLTVTMLVIWFVHVLVGDVLPRRVAHAEPMPQLLSMRLTALSATWSVFRPILSLAQWIGTLRPSPRRTAERDEIVERAFDSLADSVGLDEPVIEADEREMIRGVISLEDTEVREVMVPRINIVAVPVDATIDDVRRKIVESGHSRLPVYDETLDTIVGILYIKDLFCAEASGDVSLSALARRAFVVPETKRVDALLEEFKRLKTHIAIVVDEFGGTAGLVTLEDILEEIVGEIEDEHDGHRRAIERVSDDVIKADGVVSLYDIAEELGIDVPDEEFETIGGLIYDRVGGVPKLGHSFEEHGLRITIEKMDGQRIKRVRISRLPQSTSVNGDNSH
jgi:CBS domain containing-hemolysin-like protein